MMLSWHGWMERLVGTAKSIVLLITSCQLTSTSCQLNIDDESTSPSGGVDEEEATMIYTETTKGRRGSCRSHLMYSKVLVWTRHVTSPRHRFSGVPSLECHAALLYVLCECRRHECECIIHYPFIIPLSSFHHEPEGRVLDESGSSSVTIMQTFIVSPAVA